MAGNEARIWEDQIARMRGFIWSLIHEAGLRDGEQCALECELALWRGQVSYDPERNWGRWAKEVVRNAVRVHQVAESRRASHEVALADQGQTDEALEHWLAEHAENGEWFGEGPEETVVLRVSVDSFLKLLEEQFGADGPMLRAALALIDGANLGELEQVLGQDGRRADDRKVRKVVHVRLRAALLRFFEGEHPLT